MTLNEKLALVKEDKKTAGTTSATSAASGGTSKPKTLNEKLAEVKREQETSSLTDALPTYKPNAELTDISSAGTPSSVVQPEADKQTFWDRLSNTFSGWGNRQASNYAGAAENFLEITKHLDMLNSQQHRQALQAEENAEHYQAMLDRGTWDDGTALTAEDRARIAYLRDRNLTSAEISRNANEAIHQPISGVIENLDTFGDTKAAQSEAALAKAKEGAGVIGRTAVDLGVIAGDIASDYLANSIIPGSAILTRGARTYGSGAEAAEDKGYDIGTQALYGLGSAASGEITNRLFSSNPILEKAFGKGALDDILFPELGKSFGGRIAKSAIGEAGEGLLDNVADIGLQAAVFGKDRDKVTAEEIAYDMLLEALVGAGTASLSGKPRNGGKGSPASTIIDSVDGDAPEDKAQQNAPKSDSEAVISDPLINVIRETAEQETEAPVQNTPEGDFGATAVNGEYQQKPDAVAAAEANAEGLVGAPAHTDPLVQSIRSMAAQDAAARQEQEITPQGVETTNSLDNAGVAAQNGTARVTNEDVARAQKYGVSLDANGNGVNISGKRSEQAQSVIDRAAMGEEISLKEIEAIPEIAMALEEVRNGVYTNTLPNREGIIQNGVARAMERGSYSGDNTFNGDVRRGRRIDIVTGIAGSGKSSVFSNRISQKHGSRIIDTDDYREFIPEYNGRNAALVHEEASAIRNAIMEQALANGENIIISTVGDKADKLAKHILKYNALGYEVHLHLNHLSNEKAMGRVIARYVKDNGKIDRLVTPEAVKKMGDKPMRAYLEITGQGGTLYDTGRSDAGNKENRGGGGKGGGELRGDAGQTYRAAYEALASFDAYDNDVPFGTDARFLADISRPEVKTTSADVNPAQPAVGAAEAGYNGAFGELVNNSTAFHPVGANVAEGRYPTIPTKDADGREISRFASNVVGAKAISEENVAVVERLAAEGLMSHDVQTQLETMAKAEKEINKLKVDGAMQKLREAARTGTTSPELVGMLEALLVDADATGNKARFAELLQIGAQISTSSGRSLNMLAHLRKMDPQYQLQNIRSSVEQMEDAVKPKKKKRGNEAQHDPAQAWMTKVGNDMAKRLTKAVKGGEKSRVSSLTKTILADITRYAKNNMPETEGGVRRSEADRIYDLFSNYRQYQEAWDNARAKIEQEFKDNPEALSAFDGWLKNDAVSAFLASEYGVDSAVFANPKWKVLEDKFLAADGVEARNEVIDEMQQFVADSLPRTMGTSLPKWVAAIRYMNMLGNFKTPLARNLPSNIVNRGVYELDNAVISAVERLAGGKVGRTRSAFVGKDLMAVGKADADFVEPALVEGGGKYGDAMSPMTKNAFMRGVLEKQPVFGDIKVGGKTIKNPLEFGRNSVDWIMNNKYFGDKAFLKGAYARFLGGYLQANGITAEQWNDPSWQKANAGTVEKARDNSVRLAKEAAFRQDNAISRWVSKVARRPDTPWAVKTMAEGIQPFRRTPANVTIEAVEHSPIGLFDALYKGLRKAGGETDAEGNPKYTGTDVLEAVTKGASGTALFGLGLLLHNLGIMRGGDDEDEKQAAFDDLTGHQPFAIETEDGTSFTIDWLTPVATPVVLGAEWARSMNANGFSVDGFLDAISSVSDQMLETSFVSGLNDALSELRYSDDGIEKIALSSMLNYVTQIITSTLSGQVERATQEDSMMTYVDKNSNTPDWLQEFLGKTSAKIPGWDYQQIPYINAWGETESEEDPLVRIMNNLINPSYTSKVEVDAVEQELQRIYDAVGSEYGNVFPERADKSFQVGGKTKYLTADEYVKYAKAKGTNSRNLVEQAINSNAFKSMSDAEKAELIAEMHAYANYKAKRSVSPNYSNDTYAKYEEAEAEGISPAEFYAYRTDTNDMRADKDKNGKSISGSKEEKVIDYIYGLDLSPTEKDWLYLLNYSSDNERTNQKKLRKLPWNR